MAVNLPRNAIVIENWDWRNACVNQNSRPMRPRSQCTHFVQFMTNIFRRMPAGILALIAGITAHAPAAYIIVSSPSWKRSIFSALLRIHSFYMQFNVHCTHTAEPKKQSSIGVVGASVSQVLCNEWECQLFPVDFHTGNHYTEYIGAATTSWMACVARFLWKMPLFPECGQICVCVKNLVRWRTSRDARLLDGREWCEHFAPDFRRSFQQIRIFGNSDEMFGESQTSIFGIHSIDSSFDGHLATMNKFQNEIATFATMAATNAQKQNSGWFQMSCAAACVDCRPNRKKHHRSECTLYLPEFTCVADCKIQYEKQIRNANTEHVAAQ